MKPQKNLVLLSCCSLEHQIVISLNKGLVVVQIHLKNYRNVFKRIWVALKYIFGYKSKYGDWDEMLLDEGHVPQLTETLEYLKGKR
jgi:hypothetical protein